MRAVVYHGRNDIRMEDWPDPTPGEDEVLLRPASTGICATDVEEVHTGPRWIQWGKPNPVSGRQAPLIMGHEIVGRVETWGEEVSGLAQGQLVAVNNVRSCGECFWCIRDDQGICPNMAVAGLSADGGLAHLMTWPASHVYPLPESITEDEASLLEPATVAVRAVHKSGVKVGDKVAVVGCGTVGILAVQIFAVSGAEVTAIDVRSESLEVAAKLGAAQTLNVSDPDISDKLLDMTDGLGHDIVAESAGALITPGQAIRWTRPGGITVLVGIYAGETRFDFNHIVGGQRKIIGTAAAAPGDMETAISLVASGAVKLGSLVSGLIPLENAIRDGFERLARSPEGIFRLVVKPNA